MDYGHLISFYLDYNPKAKGYRRILLKLMEIIKNINLHFYEIDGLVNGKEEKLHEMSREWDILNYNFERSGNKLLIDEQLSNTDVHVWMMFVLVNVDDFYEKWMDYIERRMQKPDDIAYRLVFIDDDLIELIKKIEKYELPVLEGDYNGYEVPGDKTEN